eukprot:jgi/Mesvir1/6882/Mv09048-RA.1
MAAAMAARVNVSAVHGLTNSLARSQAPLRPSPSVRARSLSVCTRCQLPKISSGSRPALPPRMTRLFSLAPFPLVLAHETFEAIETIVDSSDFAFTDAAVQGFYMVFALVFTWGCLLAASTKDPFYENPETRYREDGGDGTQHWFYNKEAEAEEDARKELLKQITGTE